jgi:hypothetical protein
MPRSAHSLRFRLLIVIASTLSSLLTEPAMARTVTAHCPSVTIGSLLKTLDPGSSNTIRVLGTCQESVYIADFADLTISGVTDDGKHAVIQSLNGSPIFWIDGSHVQLQNLTVEGGLWDVMCTNFSVCRFSGNTIQNATGNGVGLDNADATFNGDVIQNNANSGLNLSAAHLWLCPARDVPPPGRIDHHSGSCISVCKSLRLAAGQPQAPGTSLRAYAPGGRVRA